MVLMQISTGTDFKGKKNLLMVVVAFVNGTREYLALEN